MVPGSSQYTYKSVTLVKNGEDTHLMQKQQYFCNLQIFLPNFHQNNMCFRFNKLTRGVATRRSQSFPPFFHFLHHWFQISRCQQGLGFGGPNYALGFIRASRTPTMSKNVFKYWQNLCKPLILWKGYDLCMYFRVRCCFKMATGEQGLCKEQSFFSLLKWLSSFFNKTKCF